MHLNPLHLVGQRYQILMTIDGKKIQFEIKGTNARKNEITFFDITARRADKSKKGKAELDKTAELYIQSVPELRMCLARKMECGVNFAVNEVMRAVDTIMEYYKSLDPTIGYGRDKGVVKSKYRQYSRPSRDLLRNIHDLILQHFTKGGDDYFQFMIGQVILLKCIT